MYTFNYIISEVPIEIYRHTLVRADCPNETKRGGVCMNHNESLAVREKIYLTLNRHYFGNDLPQQIVIISVIYRSLNQSNNEIDSFLSNLGKLVSDINNRKLELSIITSGFNARCEFC